MAADISRKKSLPVEGKSQDVNASDLPISGLPASGAIVDNTLTATVEIGSPNVTQKSTATQWATYINNKIYFSPFTAKITANGQLEALDFSTYKVINIAASITLQDDIDIENNRVTWFLSPGVTITMADKRIISSGLGRLYIYANHKESINYAPTTSTSPFSFTNGALYLSAVGIGNASTQPNTPFSDTNTYIEADSCSFTDNGLSNSCVNLPVPGSRLLNPVYNTTGNASTSVDSFQLANGAFAVNLQVQNIGLSDNNLLTIGEGSYIDGLAQSVHSIKATNSGKILNAQSAPGLNINLIVDGNNPVVEYSNFSAGTVTINETAVNPKIVSSNASGTWANNSTTYQGTANSGTIPNTTQSSSGLSPFSGVLDDVGALANHYQTEAQAYDASKTELYTTANITEITDTDLTAASQLYVQIGQANTWDLDTMSIVGSAAEDTTGANSLTVEYTDASSVLRWNNPEAGLPISNFDALSTLVIMGNGGVAHNQSAVANTYLTCLGTMIIKDLILLLPNASAGGLLTNLYHQISGMEITGGGILCDTAIIANGGSLRDIIIDGEFTDNSKLISSTSDTIYDGIFVNVATNNEIEVIGKASKILAANPSGFVIVTAKQSLQANGNTSVTQSTFDQLSIPSNTTGIKVSDCTIGLLDFATDNSTECEFVNCTILNNSPIYGKNKFTNCHFAAGFEPQSGSTVYISDSTSDVAITYSPGINYSRSNNDFNIGNSNPEQMLISAAGVALGTTGKANLFAVPTSRTCIITKVIIRNASSGLSTSTFGFGYNSDGNDVVTVVGHSELTASNLYSELYPANGAVAGAAGDMFGIGVALAEPSPTTISVDVYGYYV